MINLVIIFSILFSASSQLLLKKGVGELKPVSQDGIEGLVHLLIAVSTNSYIVAGVFFQVFALMIWLYVLKKVDVSYAYPFISLGFVFVMGMSLFIFNERIDAFKAIGALVICLGIVILSFSRQTS